MTMRKLVFWAVYIPVFALYAAIGVVLGVGFGVSMFLLVIARAFVGTFKGAWQGVEACSSWPIDRLADWASAPEGEKRHG